MNKIIGEEYPIQHKHIVFYFVQLINYLGARGKQVLIFRGVFDTE